MNKNVHNGIFQKINRKGKLKIIIFKRNNTEVE